MQQSHLTSPLLGMGILSILFATPIILFTSLPLAFILLTVTLTIIAIIICAKKLNARYLAHPTDSPLYLWLSDTHKQACFLRALCHSAGFHLLYSTPALCFILGIIALASTSSTYIPITTLRVDSLLDIISSIVFAVWYIGLFTTLWHVVNQQRTGEGHD